MKQAAMTTMAVTALVLGTGMALADEAWQPPHKEQCSLEPGQDCGADVTCPKGKSFVVNGGGGIPKVSDDNHRLAITMNLPVNQSTWRVRWRNMGDAKLDVTVAIRILCTDDDAWE